MTPEAAVQAIAQRCTKTAATVVVTAGERGVFWSGGHLPAHQIEAIDTLAAGDVFHGTFAFGLAEGWPLEQCLRFANAAAALKCTRFGGRLGAPTRPEVEAFLTA
jgi:sulfofructose kinase